MLKSSVSVLFLCLFVAPTAFSFGGSTKSAPPNPERQKEDMQRAMMFQGIQQGIANNTAKSSSSSKKEPRWTYTPPPATPQTSSQPTTQTAVQTPSQPVPPSFAQPLSQKSSAAKKPTAATPNSKTGPAQRCQGAPPPEANNCSEHLGPTQDILSVIETTNKKGSQVCSAQNYSKILESCVPKEALDNALCFLRENPGAASGNGKIAIADLTPVPGQRLQRRFFLIDTKTGKVQRFQVAAGGGKMAKTQMNAQCGTEELGNVNDSNLTPPGFLRVDTFVSKDGHAAGKVWNENFKLTPLEKRNNQSNLPRGIVIHEALYKDQRRNLGSYVFPNNTGFTDGCLAFGTDDFKTIKAQLGGALLYNYQKGDKVCP